MRVTRQMFVFVIGSVCLVSVVEGQEHASEASPILFTSSRDGKEEVYSMDADGSHVRRLTFTPGEGAFRTPQYTNSRVAAWSPDGRQIAFSSRRLEPGDPEGRARAPDIYLMAANGSELRRITRDAASDGQPDFSPDGRELAFASTRDGNVEIYRIRTDGTNLLRITHSPGQDSHPDWHPNGKLILFESRYRDGYGGLFTMSANGTDVRLLVVGMRGSWSPDGSRIAFGARSCWVMDSGGQFDKVPLPWAEVESRCAGTEDEEIRLFILQVSNGRLELLFPQDGEFGVVTSPEGLNTAQVFGGAEPRWSPDGTQLVFHYSRRGADTAEITECCKDLEVFRINADGTGLVALTWNTIFDGHMRWH